MAGTDQGNGSQEIMTRKTKRHSAVVLSLAGIGLAVLALALYVVGVDHGYLKPEVERRLSAALGRRVAIDGEMHLTIRRTIRLSVEGLRIVSEDWTEKPDLIHVGALSATVRTASLVGGPLEILDLVIDDTLICLEKHPDGRVNWQLGGKRATAAPERESPITDGVPVVLRAATVTRARAVLKSPDLEQKLHVTVDTLEQSIDEAGIIDTSLAGDINDTILGFTSRIDNLAGLIDRQRVAGHIDGSLGEIRLTGDFALDSVARPARPEFDLVLQGPDFAYLARILKLPERHTGALAVRASLRPDDDRLQFDIDSEVGTFKLSAQGRIDDLYEPQDIEAEVAANGTNAAVVAAAFGVEHFPAVPFSVTGHLENRPDDVRFEQLRLNLGSVAVLASGVLRPADGMAVDAEVSASGPSAAEPGAWFGLGGLPAEQFSARSRVEFNSTGIRLDDLRAAIGANELMGAASIQPGENVRIDADLAAKGPNAAVVAKWFGLAARFDIENIPGQPYSVSGRLQHRRDEMRFDDMRVRLGDNRVSASGSFRPGEVPVVEVTLAADRLDISEFVGPEPGASPPPTSPREDGRLIPDTPVPLDFLARLEATVRIRIGELVVDTRNLRDFSLEATIDDRRLLVERLELTGEDGGHLTAKLAVTPGREGGDFRLRLDGEQVELGLPAETEEERRALPRYDLSTAIDTSGATLQELAAGANGYLRLKSGPGRLRAGGLRFFTSDFLSQLLATVNPFLKDDPYTEIECAVLFATVKNGKLMGEPGLVVRSDRLDIAAHAEFDLGTESIHADISTVPRHGLGISLSNLVNPYIQVGGTMTEPKLEIDKKSTFIQGGAAIATGGLSILAKGMFDRVGTSENPCTAIEQAAVPAFEAMAKEYGGDLSAGQ